MSEKEEREILRVAREKAMDVLATSSAKAEQAAHEAEADAVALLREQQKAAERLLRKQDDAVKGGRAGEQTDDMLDTHRAAAELLSKSEVELAAKMRSVQTNVGVEILMTGHRQAAAILLDAWMRVTEGRPQVGE